MFARLLLAHLVSLLTISTATAFVENVTHGYTNCMSCHVAPTGGNLLTDYGRALSKELMSTWGWKNSEAPLFGAVKNTKWIKVGGDFRRIQTRFENDRIKRGSNFEMQRNIELGVGTSDLQFVGTLGAVGGPDGTPDKGEFLSERHYVLAQIGEGVFVRAGKFRLGIGLIDPNHTRVTKAPLGFGSNSESYILEVSKFTESGEFFISADLGDMNPANASTEERSLSFKYSKYLFEKNKLGISLLYGTKEAESRELLGFDGIFAPFKDSVFKFETFYERSHQKLRANSDKDLIAHTMTLGHQTFKGVMPYTVVEFLQRDLAEHTSEQGAYGVGVQWLPIPHFDFQFEFKKQFNRSPTTSSSDLAYVIAHFYL